MKENLKIKFDKFMTKVVLYQIREILIQEKNKGYYRNLANIHERLEISRAKCYDGRGREYDKIKNIIYWTNGFYEMNETNIFHPLPFTTNKKNMLKTRRKTDSSNQ